MADTEFQSRCDSADCCCVLYPAPSLWLARSMQARALRLWLITGEQVTRTQAAKQKKKFAQERRAADEAKRIAAATLLQSRYRGNSARVAHIKKAGKKKRRKLRRKRKPQQPEAAEKPVQSRKGLSRLAAPSGACGYNRPCAHQYVGKYQSCMVISGRLIVHAPAQLA